MFSIIKYIIMLCFLLEILFLYIIYDVKKKIKKIKWGYFMLYYCLFLKRGKYMVDVVIVGMNWFNV